LSGGRLCVVTDTEWERLIALLRSKQCGPCRCGDATSGDSWCVEADELIAVVGRG